MAKYKCDPRWITVRFKGSACARCKRPIHRIHKFFQREKRYAFNSRAGRNPPPALFSS
jgi:hypothetical protein